jgi:hypothetical protein
MEKVCNTSDVIKATVKGFIMKGKQILVANVDGHFFAVNATCTHMIGYLLTEEFPSIIYTRDGDKYKRMLVPADARIWQQRLAQG